VAQSCQTSIVRKEWKEERSGVAEQIAVEDFSVTGDVRCFRWGIWDV